jgi:hypothetical protein
MADDALTYPLAPPTLSGTTYTVDWLLEDPKRVTRAISRLALQKFMVDKIFSPAGDITGGAVIYDQATSNDLYATRDVQRVEPLGEFPEITFDRPTPLTAQVEKFGGKFIVSDEARRRNRTGRVTRDIQRLANTIVRKVQQRALTELAAAITANSRTATGSSWADATALTTATQAPNLLPIADLTLVQQSTEVTELGYEYDTMIVNPVDWRNFRMAVGGQSAQARAVLADSGITNVWVTNRKAQGSAYFLAAGMVGEIGYEVPLSTETWRDKDGRQGDWFQSFVLPIVYVTDPFAILEVTGLQA